MIISHKSTSYKINLILFIICFVLSCLINNALLLSYVRMVSSILLFLVVLNIKLKDKYIYINLRKMSTIIYFIHLYVWTGYYMIVYGEKRYGLDSFIVTICISTIISMAYLFFKNIIKIRNAKNCEL